MKTDPPIFAQYTSVAVDKTKMEISALLREWECEEITWAEKRSPPAFALEFTWANEGALYRIRFTVALPTKDLRDPPRELPEEKRRQAERSTYRLLLLKLKADMNAARCGLAKAEEIFLPWMVSGDGKTLADEMLPRLREKFKALPAKAGGS